MAEKRGSFRGRPFQQIPLGYSGFSYLAVYPANKVKVYEMLKLWTIEGDGMRVMADREKLTRRWYEFIVPYW